MPAACPPPRAASGPGLDEQLQISSPLADQAAKERSAGLRAISSACHRADSLRRSLVSRACQIRLNAARPRTKNQVCVHSSSKVIAGPSSFWPILLADPFGRSFWPILLADSFGRSFWPILLADPFVGFNTPQPRAGASPDCVRRSAQLRRSFVRPSSSVRSLRGLGRLSAASELHLAESLCTRYQASQSKRTLARLQRHPLSIAVHDAERGVGTGTAIDRLARMRCWQHNRVMHGVS